MPFIKAGPNQYLLVGKDGVLENRGSAVQTFLLPGTIYVLVPSTKQEAAFEFTQETRDGIPLRFKGIILYRVTDPLAAATLFDFARDGVTRITTLLTHISLGELRHAVSHMTMVECIEQRKTTLTGVVEAALQNAVRGDEGGAAAWGVTVEVGQVAQVFIVDTELRQQLEAEVRNEIKLKSEQSDLKTREEIRLAEMGSSGRVEQQQLASDKEALARQEEMQLAGISRDRRMAAEELVTERQRLEVEQEKVGLEMELERARLAVEAPVRLARIEKETEILNAELEMRRLQNVAKEFEVSSEMMLRRAQDALRREMLPIEQAPQIVEAASKVLHGTQLVAYGQDGSLVDQVGPILDLVARAVRQATQPNRAEPVSEGGPSQAALGM